MSNGLSARALSGIPDGLRAPLIEEYNKLAKNFREGRWEPAELNGGKLSEIVYTILRGHVDGVFSSKPSKPANMFRDCVALEQATAFPRSVRIQIPRMLITLYEIRNNRNVGHVGSDVDPNHMDAEAVFAMARWIMAELVRLFHNVTTQEATVIVDNLTERMIPLLWDTGTVVRVLNDGLSAKEKMLVLLYSSNAGLDVRTVLQSLEYKNGGQFRSKVATPAHKSGLIHFDVKSDRLLLSPLGARYVETNIELELG